MSGGKQTLDKDSTIYVGNLDEQVTDAHVWELMIQCGPVVNVHLPKDRVSQNHQGYGFVEFASEMDADYAIKIMNQIRLYGKPIRLNKASADKRTTADGGPAGSSSSVGAELFVGNLDSLVDERVLYETFSRFGPLLAPPKITRDDNNLSKGYGFVSYASFAASDDAIENMHGQYLMNKEVTVQYAYKKDGKGERHGAPAERALAAQAIKNGVEMHIPAMPAALVMPQQAPAPVMAGMPNGYGMGGPVMTPQGMPYGYAPTPVQAGYQYPPRQFNQMPLQVPGATAGLPPRPPASSAGYGGPMLAPGMQPPPGLAGMPPGYGPPPGAFPPR